MVKVRGRNVELVPSEYVTKDLKSIKKKKGPKTLSKKERKAAELVKLQEEKDKLKAENEIQLPDTRSSDEPAVPTNKSSKRNWRNKQRVLVFGSRGISFRGRHIMENIRRLLPHTKKEPKMEKKDNLFQINEISEMKNCNKCLFFEAHKQGDIYLWVSNIPNGPSAKFLLENVSTMEELKFTGNCLKGSRAILSFDTNFDTEPHYQLLKELFVQTFGTPYHFPKSQPFIDHVFTFAVLDNRIWFRNFQIMEEDGSLVEIGPRLVLNPIRIFEGSFSGVTVWNNEHFITPGKYRAQLKKANAGKYSNRIQQKIEYERARPRSVARADASEEIFHVDPDQED